MIGVPAPDRSEGAVRTAPGGGTNPAPARSSGPRAEGAARPDAPPPRTYFAMTMKWPRRFCDQQPSADSVQNGDSSPRLVV